MQLAPLAVIFVAFAAGVLFDRWYTRRDSQLRHNATGHTDDDGGWTSPDGKLHITPVGSDGAQVRVKRALIAIHNRED